MTIAAPFLLILGGICIGLLLPAFRRHHLIGIMLILAAVTLIALGLGNTALTIHPNIQQVHPSPSVSVKASPSRT